MVWLIVAGVAAVIALLLWDGVRRWKKMSADARNFEAEPLPVLQRQATLVEKKTLRQNTSDVLTPSHFIRYQGVFRLEDGEATECWLAPELYERLQPGSAGLLVTQGEAALAFEEAADP